MRIAFEREFDALSVMTDTPEAICASLPEGDDPYIVICLATEDGHDIAALEVLGASTFIPLGKSDYDAETDTLKIGRTRNVPDLITENGDFVGYWQVYEEDPGGFWDPIGVALRRASEHLGHLTLERAKADVIQFPLKSYDFVGVAK